MIEYEEFVSAPDKQAVINDIVSTLMNIKAHGDFTDIKPLTQLTSLVLLALDNGCKVNREAKDALYEYARILQEYTEEQPPEDTLAVKRAVSFWKEAGLAHTAKSSGEITG